MKVRMKLASSSRRVRYLSHCTLCLLMLLQA